MGVKRKINQFILILEISDKIYKIRYAFNAYIEVCVAAIE